MPRMRETDSAAGISGISRTRQRAIRKSLKPTRRPIRPRSEACRINTSTHGRVRVEPADGSGPRRTALRVVGPMAIEPRDAEVDPVIHADHAGIFADRIIDRVPGGVIDDRDAAAEAARDRLCRPRQGVELLDIFQADNAQFGIPEAEFLGAEIADNAVERPWKVACRE